MGTLWEILNLEGHPNYITGSRVTAILLNRWSLPIGGVASGKGLRLQPAQQACFSEMTHVEDNNPDLEINHNIDQTTSQIIT